MIHTFAHHPFRNRRTDRVSQPGVGSPFTCCLVHQAGEVTSEVAALADGHVSGFTALMIVVPRLGWTRSSRVYALSRSNGAWGSPGAYGARNRDAHFAPRGMAGRSRPPICSLPGTAPKSILGFATGLLGVEDARCLPPSGATRPPLCARGAQGVEAAETRPLYHRLGNRQGSRWPRP